MKKLVIAISAIALFAACNNGAKTSNTSSDKVVEEECSSISVDSFLVIAPDFVGKELTVKGTVDHVCKHGGKRVKMFSSCPSKSIHIEAGETMGNFKAEVEGSSICVVGVVAESKMDMAYVEEYEDKVKQAIENNKEEADMEHKEGVDHHAKLEQIKVWKEEIETSEKGYISSYFIEAEKYHECGADCAKDDSTKACCSKEAEVAKSCCDKKVATEGCSAEKEKACAEGEAKPCAH